MFKNTQRLRSKDISKIATDIVNLFNRNYSELLEEDKEISSSDSQKLEKDNQDLKKEISSSDSQKLEKDKTISTSENDISLNYNIENNNDINIEQNEKLPTSTEEIMDNLIHMDKDKDVNNIEGGVSLDSIVDNLVGGSKNDNQIKKNDSQKLEKDNQIKKNDNLNIVVPTDLIPKNKDISPNLFEGGNINYDEINIYDNDNSEEEEEEENKEEEDIIIENDSNNNYSDFVKDYQMKTLTGGDINFNESEQLELLPVFPYIITI